MPLTLGDEPLVIDGALEDAALALLDPWDGPAWGRRTWPGRGFEALPWGPFAAPAPPRGIGLMTWPAWGLSRWAAGHFLAHATAADRLRAETRRLLGEADDELAPWSAALTLRIEAASETGPSGNADRVELPVFLLPPRPLAAPDPRPTEVPGFGVVETSSGAYLLTVVDRRYYLRYRSVRPDIDADLSCDATWGDVYAALAADARIDLTWDEVPSDYLVPPETLAGLAGLDVALALDCVAASVGQRVVARYDGTFHAQSADGAIAARDAADLEALSAGRRRLGGGELFAPVL